ncbi:hypothetical protein M8J77_025722 [Diaphorina citri]|nr:hypothetical protein M8J77_025722 [Diaphorina citri]
MFLKNPDGGKGGEAGKPAKGQYTLKFVPLIRIIASFIPRLLSRFTTRIQGGRSLSDLNGESLDQLRAEDVTKIFAGQTCSTQHLGRWADPQNEGQFFECAVNVDSLPECQDVPPSVTKQIIEDISLNQRSARSINPSSPQHNKLIKSKSSSTPVIVYKVNPCVSLVLHVCTPNHAYSSRLQYCVPAVPSV